MLQQHKLVEKNYIIYKLQPITNTRLYQNI